jgi:hypothetical protein
LEAGADLQHDAALGQQCDGGRVLDRAHAVPEPGRAQHLDGRPHAARPAQLTGVRCGEQAGVARQPERLGELLRPPPGLVVRQPEADHPSPGEAPGHPGEGLGVPRVAGAVGRHHQRHADPGGPARRAHGVQDDLHRRLQAAEPDGVRRRVDLHLAPARAGGRLVLGDLVDQPAHVVGAAQHLARGVVQPLEAGPAAAGGDVEPGAGRVEQLDRQPAALLGGELDQRRRPHRARQVQVQVRLGELHEVPHCPAAPSAPHLHRVLRPAGPRSATLGPP